MKIDRVELSVAEVEMHKAIYARLMREMGSISGAITPRELDLLVEVYKAAKPAKSIEWGLGWGVSAVALGKVRQAYGLSGRHITLDPFPHHTREQGVKSLAEFSVTDAVEFNPVTSAEYLVQAAARQEQFDFVFIDGAHDIGHKLMDACLTSDVISPNGIISFHDSFLTSTSLALTYLKEECQMELLESGRESSLKRRLRGAKHASRLGLKYALRYAPQIDFSLSFLRKRA